MRHRAPTQTGPQAYWDAMNALTRSAGGFTVYEVAERFPRVAVNTITSYLASLVRQAFVEAIGEVETGTCGPARKRYFVKVTRVEAPAEKTAISTAGLGAKQRQLWTAMRGMPSFTTRDLAVHASTEEVEITDATARAYVSALARAGYLQRLGKIDRHPVWRLAPGRSTGPIPPAVSGGGAVTDRNPRAKRRAS